MTPYAEKHVLPAYYVSDAHTWLEDAETALTVFCSSAEPQGQDAAINVANAKTALIELNAYLRLYRPLFNTITKDLPDDYVPGE